LVGTVAQQSVPPLAVRARQVKNSPSIEIEVFSPQDRTTGPGKVVFSHRVGNIVGYEYSEEAGANVIIGGGQNVLTERDIALGADLTAALEFSRIEKFVDHRDLSLDDLPDAISADLAERALQWSVSFDLVESETFRFHEQFDVGDKVVVVVDEDIETEITGQTWAAVWPPVWQAHWGYASTGVSAQAPGGIQLVEVIREVEITLQNDVATVTPRVATPGAALRPKESRLFEITRQHEARIRDLERTV
jgi:hypothetical protein